MVLGRSEREIWKMEGEKKRKGKERKEKKRKGKKRKEKKIEVKRQKVGSVSKE